MTINITYDNEMTPEDLVIKIFDGIKCANATDNQFKLYLNRNEVKYLAEAISSISYLEIY